MKDIKTAYSLGSEGMLITRYTEDASFHEVEIKDYHEVLKDMEAGKYDADLNLALQIVDIVMDASIRDYVVLDAEEKTALIEEIPAGRFLNPQESAEIIYSVATLNSYVTGQIITADGGLT